jgi:hypothetical protein
MRFLFLFGALLLPACTSTTVDLVIRDVTVVDVPNEKLIQSQTVAIDGGRIIGIEPSAAYSGAGVTEIDGSGRYLIPGLIDAHVHVDHPDELNIYPAFGVTGIIALRGLPQHVAWRSEISAGTRFGPRLAGGRAPPPSVRCRSAALRLMSVSRLFVAQTSRGTGEPPLKCGRGTTPRPASTYKFNSWRLGYRYRLLERERLRLFIGFTAQIRDAKVELRQATTSSKKTDVGFVPLLHAAADWQLARRWGLRFDFDGLAGGPGVLSTSR